ncbi:zinc finger protein weckle [Drosophila serrata]|uniref:zinc finger protein weckle n=1 Tax=Drosophila serrata TaxID=7274 RepID=UPI000A1D0A8B|nr:zinc finger protein weckle [Drosophila serrata]
MTTSLSESEAADEFIWQRWCRLCAKDHPQNRNVYSRAAESQSWTNMLAMTIGKYFWVDIKQKDELSNYLCAECFNMMESLMEFSERVRRVQTLFNRLQTATKPGASVDYEELRQDCGLVDNDWKHLMSQNVKQLSPKEAIQKIIDQVPQIVEDADALLDENVEIIEEELQSMELQTVEEEVELQEAPDCIEEGKNIPEEEFDEESEIIEENYNIDAYEETAQEQGSHGTLKKSKLKAKLSEETQEVEEEDDFSAENLIEEDHEPAIYKCSICSKPYKKPKSYKRHMMDVHNVVPTDLPNLECNQCGIIFPTDSQLHAHYRSHLPANLKADNSCPHCEKRFTTPGTLKRHIEGVHKGIKPFTCDLCGKGFKYITGLKDHKLVHTDECPFECPDCHRRFKNKARLKIHSDTHSANIYECGICGMKLKTRRTFNKHKLVHSDERQYKCDVCGSSFKRSKTLKSHLILHTGIRPYKCNFCGREFSNGSNCRSHKRQAHPKELAEEESRGVSRSTLLPMLEELTKASKLIKTPAKPSKTKGSMPKASSKKPAIVTEPSTKDTEGAILYEIVEELDYT